MLLQLDNAFLAFELVNAVGALTTPKIALYSQRNGDPLDGNGGNIVECIYSGYAQQAYAPSLVYPNPDGSIGYNTPMVFPGVTSGFAQGDTAVGFALMNGPPTQVVLGYCDFDPADYQNISGNNQAIQFSILLQARRSNNMGGYIKL